MELLRKLSIKYRLWLQILLAMVGIACIMGFSLAQLKGGVMQEKEAKTQALVETAYSLLVGYHERVTSGAMDEKSAQQAAAAAISELRYEGKNYFWINDMHPKMVMHPIKPELNGKDISDFKDPTGKRLFQAMVDVVRGDGEGLVPYLWPKPGLDEPVSKISYVKGFQPWGWIIGSGIYVDDINALFWKSASTLALLGLCVFVALLIAAWLINRSIVQPMDKTIAALSNIVVSSEWDLTHRFPVNAGDEMGQLNTTFNRFTEKIQSTLAQVMNSVSQLTSESERISNVIKDNHLAIDSQRSETHQVATAITEMASTVKEISHNTESAAAAAQKADAEAATGSSVVSGAVQAITSLSAEVSQAFDVIQRLDDDSESIGSVLDVIRGIAEQTNLLALNAAIEAARAGDQGRGFAVVADEVRTLASRTQDSTQEIQQMIEKLQGGAREAVQAMDSSRSTAQHTLEQATTAGDSLSQIVGSVTTISEMNTQVASASEEQSVVAEEINRTIVRINEMMEQTAAGTQQAAAASEGLSQLAVDLRGLVGQFKVET